MPRTFTQTEPVDAAAADPSGQQVSPTVCVSAFGGKWHVEASWRETLLGEDAPDWFVLREGERARRQKRGHRRGVWEVRLGKHGVFAKVHTCSRGSIRGRLLFGLRATSAEREWRRGRAALSRGVATVHFVGIGRRGGRRPVTVLISEGLAQAATLTMAWRRALDLGPSQSRRRREELIDAVAETYARAHRAGVDQRDNHPQNLLVGPVGDRPRAFLVDMPSVRLSGRAVRAKRLVATFAQLEHHFRRIATRADRLRFLRRYLERADPGLLEDRAAVRRLVGRILDRRAVHAAHLARRRDRRIGRTGEYFTVVRPRRGWTAVAVLRLERRHVFPEPDVGDFDAADWLAVLKYGIFGQTAHEDPSPPAAADAACASESGYRTARGASSRVALRVARPRGMWQRLGWSVLGTPFGRFFRRCHQLRHRDVAAPLPLAYVVRRSRIGLVEESWLVLPVPAAGR